MKSINSMGIIVCIALLLVLISTFAGNAASTPTPTQRFSVLTATVPPDTRIAIQTAVVQTTVQEVTRTRTVNPCTPRWQVVGTDIEHQKRILIDLTHEERIKVDGVTSSVDQKKNPRIFDWQAWADDIRSQGYTINLLTAGPISDTSLLNYDLLIIAEPDSLAGGPAYFSNDEVQAIDRFVHRGNGLLLMGQQFMGGQSKEQYIADYKGGYVYDLVENKLISDLELPMRFVSGKTKGDYHDLMVTDNPSTMVEGAMADIWIGPDLLSPSAGTKFAAFHANSINPNGAEEIARGDDTVYTTPKNTKFSPVLKPKGSHPVLIASVHPDCGIVVVHGDPSAWQTKNYKGDIYLNPLYNEQPVAKALIEALTSTGNACANQVASDCEPTDSVTTTITPRNCDDCISRCNNQVSTDQGYECRKECSVQFETSCGQSSSCTPCQKVCSVSGTTGECSDCVAQYCGNTNTNDYCTNCANTCNNDPTCIRQSCPNCVGIESGCQNCSIVCNGVSNPQSCISQCKYQNRINNCVQINCSQCWNGCEAIDDISTRQTCFQFCEEALACSEDDCTQCKDRCNNLLNIDERAACNSMCEKERFCPGASVTPTNSRMIIRTNSPRASNTPTSSGISIRTNTPTPTTTYSTFTLGVIGETPTPTSGTIYNTYIPGIYYPTTSSSGQGSLPTLPGYGNNNLWGGLGGSTPTKDTGGSSGGGLIITPYPPKETPAPTKK